MNTHGGLDPSDPDFPFLGVDRQQAMQEAPSYDGKKSCWVPDEREGYMAAEIQETTGDEVTVRTLRGEVREVKKDDTQQMNPPKFYMSEDMANLTYLNEASILHNLRARYSKLLIYTYSGLFCVAVNPYKRIPIYTKGIVSKYRGKRRAEMPPHLFSIADNAYANMVQNRENQSMLITGESGAGKTENTKKVIGYFAMVAAQQQKSGEKSSEKVGSLEEKIIQANPVLEAYGNAKTIRNNNSSRFGKFIRIHFSPNGKIAGADIETYLLEKSRITFQQGGERNYHIFYQLLSGQFPEYCETCLVKPDPGLYRFINQGVLDVDDMDDMEEMKSSDKAFDVLGFTQDEKLSLYKTTCAILHIGEMKFKQRPRAEQAEADGTAEAEKAAFLLGLNTSDLLKSLLSPRVKVGNEFVTKGQNKDQVMFAVQALSKALYARMFQWLVVKTNQTLDTRNKKQHFIGVLDIAGFEIFEYNTFEQLCINYTNERLQQFFNHHMFVLEQEEYKREGIQWDFIDFGLDLQATIDLIEKPMGILSILEEECMFPKATDQTFLSKLYENHNGKSANFEKPKKQKKDSKYEIHFEVNHYAGTVGYNIDGWLNKNKDPINDSVIDTLAKSKEPLVSQLFTEPKDSSSGMASNKKRGRSTRTISSQHKESLNKLMKNLQTTQPHFVRCIIPNENKESGVIDAGLVLHQLRCNGVLEGIRICRKGFPNRMIYSEFKQRYSILAPNVIPRGFVDGKVVTEKVLDFLQLDPSEYRLGHSKIFFKAGVLGTLEDMRDERLSKIIGLFQAFIRGNLVRRNYQKLVDQRVALSVIQRNIRKWLTVRNWQWWKLYTRVKPLLSMARAEDDMKKREEEYVKTKEDLEKIAKFKKELEEQNASLLQAKNELYIQLQSEQDTLAETEEKVVNLVQQKGNYEAQIHELEERLMEEESSCETIELAKKKLEEQCEDLKDDLDHLELNLQKLEEDKKVKDHQIKNLNEEVAFQDEAMTKIAKEKKSLEESLKQTIDDLQAEEDKCNHLNKAKAKLTQAVDELDDQLERERKQFGDLDKVKRKIEGDLVATQETVEQLERTKADLEESTKRKEQELIELSNRLEDEQDLVLQLQKRIKELQGRCDELEEDVEAEAAGRMKAEKQRSLLQEQLDELAEQLDEAGGATQAQVELNKKRETDLQRLKKELEEQTHLAEQSHSTMKKKNNETINELNEQIDQLSKAKVKLEKDKHELEMECEDLLGNLENAEKGKSQAEKMNKSLEAQLADANFRLEELGRSSQDLTLNKSRMQSENSDLMRKLEEAESQLSQINKIKASLAKQLEESSMTAEEEGRNRAKLQAENRSLLAELQQVQDQLEEEAEGRSDMQKLYSKVNNEMLVWRKRFESGEGSMKLEEVEDIKKKLLAKLAEAESQVEAASSKASSLEKNKTRMQADIEDLMIEVERSTATANAAEKKVRAFDKTMEDWKKKVTEQQTELEKVNGENRTASAEIYRLKGQLDEAHEQNEGLKRENKNISEEIEELTEQLGEGGKNVHELEKARKRLEMEKEELQTALEEAESALEQEEARNQRQQLEMSAIRQEIDRRLAEKEEEFETTRKNQARGLESLQASLDAEARGKLEALKVKKKLEADITDLEMALDSTSRGRSESDKLIKKLQQQARDLQVQVEEEQRHRDEIREQHNTAERRINILNGEMEELRAQLESSERARKTAENEVHETNDRVAELTSQNSSLSAAKRKLESDLQSMQTDLEEHCQDVRMTEESLKKALSESSRLADELKHEHDMLQNAEKARRSLDAQVKDLQARLEESETSTIRGGKRAIQKLEQRVRELESELDSEQRRHAETSKSVRKQDRRIKELTFQSEEDRKSQDALQDMVDKLQQKLKTSKRQMEEAEETAALNLAKYRKVQHELEEAEERADTAETSLAKMRAKQRATPTRAGATTDYTSPRTYSSPYASHRSLTDTGYTSTHSSPSVNGGDTESVTGDTDA